MPVKEKNKAILIRPRNIYGIRNYPSLGLLSVATALKNAGFQPLILDDNFNEVRSTIQHHWKDTLLIGITALTSEVPGAYSLLQFIEGQSHIPIVIGGWHATLFAEQMEKSTLVDYVIKGEGEEDIIWLARQIQKGKTTPKRIPHKPINNWPKINYNLYPHLNEYITLPLTDIGVRYLGQSLRWLPYESSRGCPSRCRFCANVVAKRRRWKCKDSTIVANEIEDIVHRYHLNHIKFVDDNFFVNIPRVLDIAHIFQRYIFSWDAECRADTLSKSLLDDNALAFLRTSGLTQLTIGIESGSQKTLDLMHKDITLEQAEYAVAQCNKHGIYARCSFIVEVPGETQKDIEKTSRFINKLRKYKYFTCGVQTFRPYPRCDLTQELIQKDVWKEPDSFTRWTDPHNVEVFTKAQMQLPWQVQPERSERMAAYQSMESAVEIGLHKVSGWTRRKIRILQWLAHWRNRLGFYRWSVDLKWYRKIIARESK